MAAYEKAYLHARDPALRRKAREFALKYEADAVYKKYWAPILEEMSGKPPKRAKGGQRKIWSPVMFRNETDMLEMRLAETAGLVDRTVLVEADQSRTAACRSR